MCMGGSRSGGAASAVEPKKSVRRVSGLATQKSPISSKALTMRSTTAVTHILTAKPQVTDQYGCVKQLTLALADSNLLNSSAAAGVEPTFSRKKVSTSGRSVARLTSTPTRLSHKWDQQV